MKIAVAADGNTLESIVADQYEQSAYLLVVETDDLSFEVYPNEERGLNAELGVTQKLLKRNCEALISGSIEQANFDPLADAQVTRYYGAGYSVRDALRMMETNQLQLIRDYKGGQGMAHEHHDGTCNCGNHAD